MSTNAIESDCVLLNSSPVSELTLLEKAHFAKVAQTFTTSITSDTRRLVVLNTHHAVGVNTVGATPFFNKSSRNKVQRKTFR